MEGVRARPLLLQTVTGLGKVQVALSPVGEEWKHLLLGWANLATDGLQIPAVRMTDARLTFTENRLST